MSLLFVLKSNIYCDQEQIWRGIVYVRRTLVTNGINIREDPEKSRR